MQSVVQSIVKIQGENEISMKSAWIQHEFSMNSTPVWFYHALSVMVNYKLS